MMILQLIHIMWFLHFYIFQQLHPMLFYSPYQFLIIFPNSPKYHHHFLNLQLYLDPYNQL